MIYWYNHPFVEVRGDVYQLLKQQPFDVRATYIVLQTTMTQMKMRTTLGMETQLNKCDMLSS
jgi:hypothetical protein